MRIIGLTGGIAAGKTMITDYLAGLGARIVDADRISRRLTAPGSAVTLEIGEVFGARYLDEGQALRRGELARLIFADEGSRLALNRLLHPAIDRETRRELGDLAAAGEKAALLVAPLLFETGMDAWLDEVWVVALSERRQAERLMVRDGLSLREAQGRLAAQSSLAEKLSKADRVIDNNGSPAEAQRVAGQFWREALERAAARGAGAAGPELGARQGAAPAAGTEATEPGAAGTAAQAPAAGGDCE
ncbi:MAG: dephospho-CoA kinase [Peptococcaceae bacterium]|nr:dephospho-CoA kinase [Peptococcaceae bacterium]